LTPEEAFYRLIVRWIIEPRQNGPNLPLKSTDWKEALADHAQMTGDCDFRQFICFDSMPLADHAQMTGDCDIRACPVAPSSQLADHAQMTGDCDYKRTQMKPAMPLADHAQMTGDCDLVLFVENPNHILQTTPK
jgi:hypothetical protein